MGTTITELTELTSADANDELVIVDVSVAASAGTKKITVDNLLSSVSGWTEHANSGLSVVGVSTYTFSDIPAGVTEIRLFADQIETSGSTNTQIRIGNSSGVETTGYNATLINGSGTGQYRTIYFQIMDADGGSVENHCCQHFYRANTSNLWYTEGYAVAESAVSGMDRNWGRILLTGDLSQIQIYNLSGNWTNNSRLYLLYK